MFSNFFFVRLKRKLSPYVFLNRFILYALLGVVFFILLIKVVIPKISSVNYLNRLFASVSKPNEPLRIDNSQVNLLVMGIGGENHDGADLTDTIIVANLNLKTKQVRLITIPRDLWIEEFHEKINFAYHLGNNKKKGTGLILTKATVSQILAIPIHYAVVIDFNAFSKIVDLVGGVDINIDNTFDDYGYPIEGKENDTCGKTEEEVKDVTENNVVQIFPCRFEHLHFNRGVAHMNGVLALKYVRSRHAEGSEGTDFARSKRQLKLIEAIKTKINNPIIYLNPQFILNISTELQKNIDTDLSTSQMLYLGKQFLNTRISAISTMPIDIGTEEKPGLLYNPPLEDYGGEWVLAPKSGNWQQIRNQVESFLRK